MLCLNGWSLTSLLSHDLNLSRIKCISATQDYSKNFKVSVKFYELAAVGKNFKSF